MSSACVQVQIQGIPKYVYHRCSSCIFIISSSIRKNINNREWKHWKEDQWLIIFPPLRKSCLLILFRFSHTNVMFCYVLWISVQFILKESLLGWDCEWFSDLSTIVHLIQISGKNCVWLIDGKWLMELKSNCEAQKLFELIVHNKSIYHVFKGIDDIVLLQK